jgi:hypothetical protein
VAFAPTAPWSVVFITASSATFTVITSSVVLISVAFLAAAADVETSLTAKSDSLPPEPSGAVAATTLGSGCGVVAA